MVINYKEKIYRQCANYIKTINNMSNIANKIINGDFIISNINIKDHQNFNKFY